MAAMIPHAMARLENAARMPVSGRALNSCTDVGVEDVFCNSMVVGHPGERVDRAMLAFA